MLQAAGCRMQAASCRLHVHRFALIYIGLHKNFAQEIMLLTCGSPEPASNDSFFSFH